MTKIELEVISNEDMYSIKKKGMRGGVSYISNTYSKANNKYFKSYDSKHELNHIIYITASNLSDYAMFKFLSTTGYFLKMDRS